MEKDLISIIIPVYNTERYLAACLDSVISQSYHNLEIIVVNDGSSDYSLQIAESYAAKDDRIRLYSSDNEGPSEARNRGLNVATGDYIAFVDSDDILLPDALEIMLETINHKNADLIEGVSLKGSVYKEVTFPKKLVVESFTPSEAISNILYQKTLLPSAWGKLYKSYLFENLRFEKDILYEDLNIFYHIIDRCKKIIWIDFPVYFYRETEGSILHTWKPQRLDVLKVTKNIEDYISNKYPNLLPAAKDRRLSANFNMFSLCSYFGEKERAKECWQHIKKNRVSSLFNPRVRIKNKAGILLSYFGKNVFNLAARRFLH